MIQFDTLRKLIDERAKTRPDVIHANTTDGAGIRSQRPCSYKCEDVQQHECPFMEAHFGLFMQNGFRKAPGAHVGLPEQLRPEQALYDKHF